MAMPFTAPVPKEWVAKWGKQIGRHPLGTGPYMFDHWTPSQDLLLKRNPNYTGTTAGYVDAIHFEFSITPTTAVLKVQSGDADLLGNYIPPVRLSRPRRQSAVEEPGGGRAGGRARTTCSSTSRSSRSTTCSCVRRCRGPSTAPRSSSCSRVQAVALNQIYPAGLPGHVDGPAGNFYGYDPAKAKQLLSQAGYPNGFSTTLYSTTWPVADGAAVDPVRPRPDRHQGEHQAARQCVVLDLIGTKGAVGIGLNDWWEDYPDPFDFIVSLFSKSSAIDEGTNPSFWWDPKVEKRAHGRAQVMTDPAARLAKFDQIQSYIMSQAPGVPLYQDMVTTLHSKRAGGIYLHPVWIFDFEHYWINK